MLVINQIESTDSIANLKQQYVETAKAPLDGMWLNGFVPHATHFEIRKEASLLGYYCVNESGFMLQFYLAPEYQCLSADAFKLAIDLSKQQPVEIVGAFVSTAEPGYLSLCLDHFSQFNVNAHMYQMNGDAFSTELPKQALNLTLLSANQLSQAVTFAINAIGAPEQWLTGYYANLIERKELFGYFDNSQLLATGELRKNDQWQTTYADVGMIVAKEMRGKGVATKVLQRLIQLCREQKLKPICSTEATNIAAQKAIANAGFVTNNRIIQFS